MKEEIGSISLQQELPVQKIHENLYRVFCNGEEHRKNAACLLSESRQKSVEDYISHFCSSETRVRGLRMCSDSRVLIQYAVSEVLYKEARGYEPIREAVTVARTEHEEEEESCRGTDQEQRECLIHHWNHTMNWWLNILSHIPDDDWSHCSDSSFLVAIDIGHAKKKYGAKSARGRKEFDFNKSLSIQLKAALGEREIRSYFINPTGAPISLLERAKSATRNKASIFVSIHHDSAQTQFLSEWRVREKKYLYTDDIQGFSLFFSGRSKAPSRSRELATVIAQQLVDHGWMPSPHHAEPIKGENRNLLVAELGIYRWDGLGVLKRATMPAILMEAGVIVNRNEEKRLNDRAHQVLMADRIAEGISLFCSR